MINRIGAPIKLVITLKGSSDEVKDLAISSHISNRDAPTIAVAGMSFLLSTPTIGLAMCGLTTPIHVIIPAIEVEAEVANVAKMIDKALYFFTSTPNAFASSSPKESMLKTHLRHRMPIIPIIIGITAISKSPHLIPEKLPKSQNTIVGSLLYGSARYFANPTNAEKNAEKTLKQSYQLRSSLINFLQGIFLICMLKQLQQCQI